MTMARNWKKGVWKRRSNILYKLRKKGVRVNTKEHTIFIPYGEDPEQTVQVDRLRKEYHFTVQFEII